MDIITIGLVLWGLFGKTMRPFLALIILTLMRQIAQALISFPIPQGLIWHYPGFPSLTETYDVATDFFFSSHVGITALAALAIAKRNFSKTITYFSVFFVLTMAIFMLTIRAHYTADIIAGCFAAVTSFLIAGRLSPRIDRFFAR